MMCVIDVIDVVHFVFCSISCAFFFVTAAIADYMGKGNYTGAAVQLCCLLVCLFVTS